MPDKGFFLKQKLTVAKPLNEISQSLPSLNSAEHKFESQSQSSEELSFKLSGFAGTDYWLEGTMSHLNEQSVEINYISSMKHLDISPKLRRYIPRIVFVLWLVFFVYTLGLSYNNYNLPEQCIYTSASGRTSIIRNSECDKIQIENARYQSFVYMSWLIPLGVYLVMSRVDFYAAQHRAAEKASKQLEAEFLRIISG